MPSLRFQSARERRLSSGFTLLELIITLAISAILITLAIPSMQTFLGGSALTATSNDFVHGLQNARSEAIKRAAPVALCPSDAPMADDPACSAGSYVGGWIVFADDDGNGLRNGTEELIHQAQPSTTGFAFTADPALSERIWFNEAGTSTNPAGVPLAGSILIAHSGSQEQRRVRVSANGRISTEVLHSGTTP